MARTFWSFLAGCLLPLGSIGCRCDQPHPPPEASAELLEPEPATKLEFPNELRVEDESVNAFVTRAMTTCATGDYDAFRLLWSVREDPLPRDDFEQGWQAVERILIRALKKARVPVEGEGQPNETELVYAVYAQVDLDPSHQASRRESVRQVVSLIVREHDQWRLAGAPRAVRTWMLEQAEKDKPPAPQPPQTP